ncbi:MAG: phosphotransferase [Chloroflexota bacterium]
MSSIEPIFATWPENLRATLTSHYGQPTHIDALRGLSHNRVWCVSFGTLQLIVKASVQPNETLFYQDVAPKLVVQGIALPEFIWGDAVEDIHWLVIEYIPHPLPRKRWLADPDVITLLHTLHHSTLAAPSWEVFCPTWTDLHTTEALTFFDEPVDSATRVALVTLQARSQSLLILRCCISGDPNPSNWGLRDDGTIVLFDWERFGYGTPALDLAITIPGLGTVGDFTVVAEQYLSQHTTTLEKSYSTKPLANDIAIAKAWSVVEFLSMVSRGQVSDVRSVPSLVQRLPEWLAMVVGLIG